ncbi:MAG: TIGR03619 family F420-dependent LLM class oxidoreductase [Acidobacteria bacterium]|nr:TIGR03619 family F420-dependent LLM class oxidoreductase [Acidobacteriota bacterium]
MTLTPQLSIQLITFSSEDSDWSVLLDQACAADDAGIDRVVVSDHVAFGENLDAYGDPSVGGTEGGRQPTGPDGHWLEPMTVLAMIAARTERVRIGTNILQAALRRPAVLAKTAATLDVLSGGRLDLGVGVGWQREEYEVAGLEFDDRGALLNETLEVLQRLWTDQTAAHDGEALSFDGIHQMPKPIQTDGVPIWVSGTVNRRSMDRLARYGQGWIPWGPDAVDVVSGIAAMRSAVSERGRDASEIAVLGNLPLVRDEGGEPDPVATMAGAGALIDAGVTDLRISLRLGDDRAEVTAQLAAFVSQMP